MSAETEKPEAQAKQGGKVDWAAHWKTELTAAHKWFEKWHKRAEAVEKEYLDERDEKTGGDTKWNYFTSNVQTRKAMLYGQSPRSTVSRTFADSADDDARVAAIMLERKLNCDLETDGDGFADALGDALDDFERPGLGFIKWRYESEFETVDEVPAQIGKRPNPTTGLEEDVELAPKVDAYEKKTTERVESDYIHWRDVRWSPCRRFRDVRWVAFLTPMTKEDVEKRFGAEVAKLVPYAKKKAETGNDAEKEHPWDRADVWEVWDKERRKVFWYVDGVTFVLDEKDDPLGLDNFFPFGRPLVANVTTSAFLPVPNYCLTQDLYIEINTVSTRITNLERAIVVRGLYDSAQPSLAKLLTGGGENQLLPADSMAAMNEKGGIAALLAWMPLEPVVNALTALRDYRKELVDALFQLTGMSDIMRGQATSSGATATEQRAKVQFGSVRMQALQDEFARFASDSLKVKAEIICKHFEPQTIIEQSNILRTADADKAQAAVALLKSGLSGYRVEVKPEAVSLTDFAAQKQDATEFIGGLATFLQAATPLAQTMPAAMPHLLKMLQWSMSKFRGAQEIEGVLDEAIESAEMAAQQPQQQAPDPKLAQIAAKSQADIAKADKDLQNDVVRAKVDVEVERQKQQAQTEFNVMEHRAKVAIKPPAMAGGPK